MKKCIKCGKEFESNDGRVKKCSNCRNASPYYTSSKEEFEKILAETTSNEELEKILAETTSRVQNHLKKLRRINLLKSVLLVTYRFTILLFLVIILLIVAK